MVAAVATVLATTVVETPIPATTSAGAAVPAVTTKAATATVRQQRLLLLWLLF